VLSQSWKNLRVILWRLTKGGNPKNLLRMGFYITVSGAQKPSQKRWGEFFFHPGWGPKGFETQRVRKIRGKKSGKIGSRVWKKAPVKKRSPNLKREAFSNRPLWLETPRFVKFLPQN